MPINASYDLTDPQGQLRASGSGGFGFALHSGVVHELGGGGGNGPGQWSVGYYQITSSSITSVRVVDGKAVVESGPPLTVNKVRFSVLAVQGSTKKVLVEGLNPAGQVVSATPFSFPPPPRGQVHLGGRTVAIGYLSP
jgi:hypothetical protein